MVLNSNANSTEITFIKKQPSKEYESTYKDLKEYNKNGKFRNQYGSKYSYFSKPTYKYKPRGYSNIYQRTKYKYSMRYAQRYPER